MPCRMRMHTYIHTHYIYIYIYEKEAKITHYTIKYFKLLKNTTKTMPWGAKDYDYPMTLRKKKKHLNKKRKTGQRKKKLKLHTFSILC